jgi:hypothetical protein
LTAIAAAIPTPGKVSLDPGVVLTNGALAALAAALLGLTSVLFDETFGALRERSSLPQNRVTNAIGAAANRAGALFSAIATPTAWKFGNARVRRVATIATLTAFLALAALIGAFLDPSFQPNTLAGVVTFVTLLAALAVVNLATALGEGLTARSRQLAPGLRVRPGALLLVVAGVAISRSIGFLPGYLLGLPAGLAFAAEANLDRDAAIGRASIFAAIAAGLTAWLLSWPIETLSAGLSGSPSSGAAALALSVAGGAQSALLTIFLIAVEFALFDLLPIGSTAGRFWFAQKKLIWGVAFGVVAFGALHTLLNPNRAGLDALRNPSLLPLGAIAAVYSGVTLIAWLLTNESRIRAQKGLNRRSALIAGALIVAWLGGIACVALSAAASAINSTSVLMVVALGVIVGLGAWFMIRARVRRTSTPKEQVKQEPPT